MHYQIRLVECTDSKAKRSLILMNRERCKMLQWPKELLLKDINFRRMLESHKLGDLLTNVGRQSLPFFNIRMRAHQATVGQLTIAEWRSVARHLKYPELGDIAKEILSLPIQIRMIQGSLMATEIFPTKNKQLVRMSTLTSKYLRLNLTNEDDSIICLYKLGLALTPGEVLSWTGRLRKLTSTRHRNILLRLAHGDIFSNARLARFGLRQESGCANCPEQYESILHKVKDCCKAKEAWRELEKVKAELNLDCLSDLTIENLVGAKDSLNKIELALNAELIHRLTSRNQSYNPKLLVKAVIKLIGYSERLDTALKDKFKNLLMNWT